MNDDAPSDDEDAHAELRARVQELRQEHADIDASVEALASLASPDQLMIARLKRKKLALRDEIVRIEALILPNIIA